LRRSYKIYTPADIEGLEALKKGPTGLVEAWWSEDEE